MPAVCGGRDEAFTAETPRVLVVVRKMFTTENAESTEAFVFLGRLWTDAASLRFLTALGMTKP
jgi:hypothetical protein